MSLTSLIKKNKEFQNILGPAVAERSFFHTLSGRPAFSRKEYVQVCPYDLDAHTAGTVGTAYDYLCRFLIARHVGSKDVKKQALHKLVATNGLKIIQISMHPQKPSKWIQDMEALYQDSMTIINQFLFGDMGMTPELLAASVRIAMFEQAFRVPSAYLESVIQCLETPIDKRILSNLSVLAQAFQDLFLIPPILTEHSHVIFNPGFGSFPSVFGGADADLFIDGTLYDFKTSKKVGYDWKDSAQITAYYLLDLIAKRRKDEKSSLYHDSITRLAFYRARYHEIEVVDISTLEAHKPLEETLTRLIEFGNRH